MLLSAVLTSSAGSSADRAIPVYVLGTSSSTWPAFELFSSTGAGGCPPHLSQVDAGLPPAVVALRAPQMVARFDALARQWRDETAHLSSIHAIVSHPCYLQIIGLGYSAVPLLLAELRDCPDHWFVALSAITGENPVPPEDSGHVLRMAEHWLRWGRRRQLL